MAEQPRLPAGYTLVGLDVADSTNDEAKARAERGAPDGTVVWARAQTAGRGRQGRVWVSPPGNLYLSVLLRPNCPADIAPQLSFVGALAAADLVDAALPGAARCKWPNDVLIAGRKVAGILLESSLAPDRTAEWIVLGTGVNLAHHPGLGPPRPSTSLAEHGAEPSEPAAALETYLAALALWRGRWMAHGFAPIREAWLARAYGLGEKMTVMVGGTGHTGSFEGLDESGALIMRALAGGTRRVAAGEVLFGDATTAREPQGSSEGPHAARD